MPMLVKDLLIILFILIASANFFLVSKVFYRRNIKKWSYPAVFVTILSIYLYFDYGIHSLMAYVGVLGSSIILAPIAVGVIYLIVRVDLTDNSFLRVLESMDTSLKTSSQEVEKIRKRIHELTIELNEFDVNE